MVELEQLNQYRFYTLEPILGTKCDNMVDNIYNRVDASQPETRLCNSILWLHMKDGSVNLICRGCFKQQDIVRACTACNREHMFEDLTCDNCEKHVIDLTTWNVSIDECNKALKKINRAFKKDLISEAEWKSALKIQNDERTSCEKALEKSEYC
jgi:predicted amidophosphoribosyltransferase